jgi:hypothetical protein
MRKNIISSKFSLFFSFRNKRAEQIQKREQRQAAEKKQEMANKQMANIMDKYVKRIDKSSQVRIHI